jgi:hypothetical protein
VVAKLREVVQHDESRQKRCRQRSTPGCPRGCVRSCSHYWTHAKARVLYATATGHFGRLSREGVHEYLSFFLARRCTTILEKLIMIPEGSYSPLPYTARGCISILHGIALSRMAHPDVSPETARGGEVTAAYRLRKKLPHHWRSRHSAWRSGRHVSYE